MDYATALRLFTAYLERRFGDRSTPMHYLSDLRLFFACVGAKPPIEVNAQDVDRFVTAQREQNLSAATINRRLAALHTFFECLAAEAPDRPWPNPVHWRRHQAKQGLRLPRDAADAGVAQLFAAISGARDTALFGLMVGAGLRVGEVATLRLSDLTAPPQPAQVARLRVWGKGRRERLVWLTPAYYAQVSAWLAVRPASATDHLFLSQRGQALSVDGIQARLAHYCAQAGLTLTCHQLRHTFARRLAEQRMPIEGIAKLLGHAQVETTQRYTAGADPDLRAAFEQAMAEVAASATALPSPTPGAVPAPPPRLLAPADRAPLTAALQRLAALPAWLQDVLVAYVRRRWFTWKPHLAAEHADRLTRQLRRLWAWLLAYRPLNGWADLQRSDLAAWLTARQTAGIAIPTQRSELATLLAVLHFAAAQDLPIAANLFRIAYPDAPAPLPRHLSDAEYERLAATVLAQTASGSPTACQEQAWFLTLTHTGLRINELLDLRLSDLDLPGRRLLIRQAKNGADRLVYLTPQLVAALQGHLALRPTSPDDHLWLHAGQPVTANHIRYRLLQWGQNCDVAVSPHRLRHTFATRLVNHGLALEAVRKLLGHTTLHMTQHYGRLYDTTVQRQFEAAMTEIAGLALTQPSTAATPRLVTAEADSL